MPHSYEFDPRQYMLDNAFEAFYYSTADFERVAPHYHNFYEIYLFENGDVTYVVGDHRYHLQPGDILFMSPKTSHHPIFNDTKITYSRLVLWISELFIENAKESCNCNFSLVFDIISEHKMHLLRLQPAMRNQLFDTVSEMALRQPSTYSRALNNICLLEFLVNINQLYTGYHPSFEHNDRFTPHLVKAIDFINHNYEKQLTLEQIADVCFISKYHLAHGFKRTMGMSVYRYINMRRIFRSRQLLLSGMKPGVVGKKCGFPNYSSFFRAFKAEYAVSPSQLENP